MLWVILYPPAYYLIGQGSRARVPILFVTLLPAAFFLCRVMENGNPFKNLIVDSRSELDRGTGIGKQSAMFSGSAPRKDAMIGLLNQ